MTLPGQEVLVFVSPGQEGGALAVRVRVHLAAVRLEAVRVGPLPQIVIPVLLLHVVSARRRGFLNIYMYGRKMTYFTLYEYMKLTVLLGENMCYANYNVCVPKIVCVLCTTILHIYMYNVRFNPQPFKYCVP